MKVKVPGPFGGGGRVCPFLGEGAVGTSGPMSRPPPRLGVKDTSGVGTHPTRMLSCCIMQRRSSIKNKHYIPTLLNPGPKIPLNSQGYDF